MRAAPGRRTPTRRRVTRRRAIKPRTVRRRKRTRLRARRRRDSRVSRSASWSPTRQDLAWPRGETPLRRRSPLVFAALPPCSRFERRIRPFAGASSMAVWCNGRSTQERPGSIRYRADEGVTLTAGVAPSTTACWLVGRAGAIVRTIDGRTWQRVRFPEPLDFTAVVAGDARTATVTAADGRQFATTDGGTTWTRR